MAERHHVVTHPYAATLIRIKASQLCQRADFTWSDLEDLHQEMRLYLLKVAHHFDRQRASIETFIAHAIESCVQMILRDRWRDKRRISWATTSLEGTEIPGERTCTRLGSSLGADDQARRTGNSEYDPIEEIDRRDAFAYVLRRMAGSTTYEYAVAAINSVGVGLLSQPASDTTEPAPLPDWKFDWTTAPAIGLGMAFD